MNKLIKIAYYLGALLLIGAIFTHADQTIPGETDAYWYDKAFKSIVRGEDMRGNDCKGRIHHNQGRSFRSMAKNVILFVGDGMGLPTIVASRILKGQKAGKPGEETYLAWENFPNTGLIRTYNTDHQVSDSAGTATAIVCGVKTKFGTIGVNDSVTYRDCDSVPKSKIDCLSDWFIHEGKSVGVVTNTRLTHATPSSLYAETAFRDAEGIADFAKNNITRTPNCVDIAWQLVNQFPGNAIKVAMGGGWRKWLKKNQTVSDLFALSNEGTQNSKRKRSISDLNDAENDDDLKPYLQDDFPDRGDDDEDDDEDSEDTDLDSESRKAEKASRLLRRKKRIVFSHPIILGAGELPQGERTDTNLVSDWIQKQKAQRRRYAFVADRKQLAAVSPSETDYLLGLFSHDHMTYAPKRVPGTASDQEPTLLEMAMKAIDVLEKDPNGYFLLIEGGRIDIAHHEGTPHIAMEETLKFDETIQAVYERVNGRPPTDYYFEAEQQHKPEERETLVVVTADHSHVFSVGGYPVRGNPIFGFNRESFDKPYEISDVDGLPYTVLSYGNGPGGKAPRSDITSVDTSDINYMPRAAVPLTEESHGGEDVAIYAAGPGGHLFYGVQEQNYIAHAIGYASCVGPYAGPRCRKC